MTLSRRRREPRSDREVAEAAARLIRAVGQRAATADPDAARHLLLLERKLTRAWAEAVAGWRATGFSDTDIGRELHVTRQAVRQRWPREVDQPHPTP